MRKNFVCGSKKRKNKNLVSLFSQLFNKYFSQHFNVNFIDKCNQFVTLNFNL